MAESHSSPTVYRHRLSIELTRLREDTGMTQTQVANELDLSQGTLTRIEKGNWQRPNLKVVAGLLELYQVPKVRREELMAWAREARKRDWWYPYKDLMRERYGNYAALEGEAVLVLDFSGLMFSGLFQTPDYARALIQGWSAMIDADEVKKRVEIRMKRQEILTRDENPVRVWAVIDEAVLHRRVGSREVMRAQIEHLIEVAQWPNVTIQVIPFTAGAHPGLAGPFTILKFPAPSIPQIVYLENLAGEHVLQEPAEVDKFTDGFMRLVAGAQSPSASLTLLAEAAANL